MTNPVAGQHQVTYHVTKY